MKIDSITSDRVKRYMNDWYDWTQEEYILDFRQPVTIEPRYGWAITSKRKLLYYSLGISRTWFLPKPSIFPYLFRKKVKQVQNVVSFRDTGEENYFHFFNDVVAKYQFLQQHNVDISKRQVLISKRLYDKPYFQWYMKHLPAINWLVQDDEYIETKSAIFCKPLTHRRDLLKKIFEPVVSPSLFSNRIFVTRGRNRLRYIENGKEVIELVRKHGFSIVDPDVLSPGQQQEVFSGASIIVGVHGAALTNIFFREGDCRVLEIFPPPEEDYLPFHYIMIASLKGFTYDGLIGEGTKLNISAGFTVDVQQLEQAVLRML